KLRSRPSLIPSCQSECSPHIHLKYNNKTLPILLILSEKQGDMSKEHVSYHSLTCRLSVALV
ncbi:hypothetical protein QP561_11705, partial [Veillonella nakazawae]|nr:hypothetical protein [Veillonella nakazawae]